VPSPREPGPGAAQPTESAKDSGHYRRQRNSSFCPRLRNALIAGLNCRRTEEVRAGSSLPVWRRDDSEAMALRITKTSLEAIDIEDEATDSYPAEARELVFSGDLIVFVVTIRTFVVAGSGHFALVGSTVIGPRGNSL
jgi:hypothetical protein